MKSRLTYSLHLCFIVSALVLTSCGKKENKVNSSLSSSSSNTNALENNPIVSQTISTQVQSLKSNVTCVNRGYRLSNDVSFYINGGYLSGTTKIGGNWAPGFLSNGTISKMWVGVSPYGDLMFVTQVAQGSKVMGFNVTLSFCEMKSANNLPSIISNERKLSEFAAPGGIYLDSNTYCGYSVVDYAPMTTIVSERDLNNPLSPPTTKPPYAKYIYTSFTKPNCNGQF